MPPCANCQKPIPAPLMALPFPLAETPNDRDDRCPGCYEQQTGKCYYCCGNGQAAYRVKAQTYTCGCVMCNGTGKPLK